MKSFSFEKNLKTNRPIEIIDITDWVSQICTECEIEEGILTLNTQHTTTSLMINEKCERLQRDMIAFLKRLVPKGDYEHDSEPLDQRTNAHSHLMSMLLGSTLSIPVTQKKPEIGVWQSVFFVELDGPRTTRNLKARVVGV